MDVDYRLVLDALADAVIAADRAGDIVYVNGAAERLLGWRAAELTGQPLKRIVPVRLHAAHEAGFARYLATGVPRVFGRPVRVAAARADGSEVDVELTLSVVRAGDAALFAASLRDVGERIEVERQIAVTGYLRATAEAAALLTSGLALGQVMEAATETLVRDFHGVAAQIWLHDGDAGRLRVRASTGPRPEEPRRLPLWLEAVSHDRTPFIGTTDGDGPDAIISPGTTVAAFPLQLPGEATGVLVHATAEPLTDEAIEALRGFVAVLTASLSAARLLGYVQSVRAEAEDASRRFGDLLDGVRDAIVWEADAATGRFTFVSQSAASITGYPVEVWLADGEFWKRHVHPDDCAYAVAEWTRHATAGGDRDFEYRLVAAGGETVWIRDRAYAVAPSAGGPRQLRGLMLDTTARKTAERRLAAEHATSRVLAEASTIEEASARIVRAICESLDWELGALWTIDETADVLHLRELWHRPDLEVAEFEGVTRHLEFRRGVGLPGRVWATGDPAWIPDVVTDANFPRAAAATKDGLHAALGFPILRGRTVVGVIEFFSREIRPPDADLLRMLTAIGSQIGQFIERKRGEDERAQLLLRAEDANRAKDDFLATVSHELRTPLTAMLGWARLLRGGRLDAAAASHALEVIERNTEAQAQLIEDLLDISRITSGKLRLDVQSVDLVHVIEAAINTVTPAADAKSIPLQRVLDPSAGPVAGDPDRLQQVVWNLLSNAIKFTPKGGRVRLQLARSHSHVEITVADTGGGIVPEFLPYVFDRFRQAEAASSRAQGGLGIGLAIVRHLVELHGGTVRAASDGTDRGATFTVSLPIAATRPGLPDARVHPTVHGRVPFDVPPNLAGVQVLVVDDEPDARTLVASVLEQCGASVHAVASVAEALEAFERARPDVLVSDIGMPGEDGYALIRKIRARRAEDGGRVPAAALTAYARTEDRMRALSAGFQLHVPKPVEPAELATVVATLAGRHT